MCENGREWHANPMCDRPSMCEKGQEWQAMRLDVTEWSNKIDNLSPRRSCILLAATHSTHSPIVISHTHDPIDPSNDLRSLTTQAFPCPSLESYEDGPGAVMCGRNESYEQMSRESETSGQRVKLSHNHFRSILICNIGNIGSIRQHAVNCVECYCNFPVGVYSFNSRAY